MSTPVNGKSPSSIGIVIQKDGTFSFDADFQVESYLRYQGSSFVERFDANSYLQITHAMDRYDAAVKYGSLDEVCRRITSRLLIVSISGDWLFSEGQSRALAAAMLRRNAIEYVSGLCGHT